MEGIIKYWEDNNIKRRRLNCRTQSLFVISTWRVYNRVHKNLSQTNNSAKGWHHTFQLTLDLQHPFIFVLKNQFIKEHDQVEIDLAHFQTGFKPPEASKNKYVQVNRWLQELVKNYHQADIFDYLHHISFNLTL